MADVLPEPELCKRAWEALLEKLGMAEAIRFVSMLRPSRPEYVEWRRERFKDLGVSELINALRATAKPH